MSNRSNLYQKGYAEGYAQALEDCEPYSSNKPQNNSITILRIRLTDGDNGDNLTITIGNHNNRLTLNAIYNGEDAQFESTFGNYTIELDDETNANIYPDLDAHMDSQPAMCERMDVNATNRAIHNNQP